MNTNQFVRVLLVCLLAASAAFGMTVVDAQDASSPVNTLILTEAYLNTALRLAMQEAQGELTVDLQPGQMILNLATTDRRGNPLTMSLTFAPVVANGQLDLNATQFSLNGLVVNLNENAAAAGTTNTINNFLTQQVDAGMLQSVAITDTDVTLTWLRANPDEPVIVIQDNLLSLSFSEASINRMAWVTNPADPLTTSINVDLRPGQAILSAVRTVTPTEVAFIVTPTIANNRVIWQVESQIGGEADAGSNFLAVWRAYAETLYSDTRMTNVVITDDAVTFTWDISEQNAQPSGMQDVVYTLEEAEANAVFAGFMTQPTDSLTVDMQAGQVILNAATVGAAGNPLNITLTLVPVLSSGTLTWSAAALTVNGMALDVSAFQSGNQVSQVWTQGLEGVDRSAEVIGIQITDTSMAVTVRYR